MKIRIRVGDGLSALPQTTSGERPDFDSRECKSKESCARNSTQPTANDDVMQSDELRYREEPCKETGSARGNIASSESMHVALKPSKRRKVQDTNVEKLAVEVRDDEVLEESGDEYFELPLDEHEDNNHGKSKLKEGVQRKASKAKDLSFEPRGASSKEEEKTPTTSGKVSKRHKIEARALAQVPVVSEEPKRGSLQQNAQESKESCEPSTVGQENLGPPTGASATCTKQGIAVQCRTNTPLNPTKTRLTSVESSKLCAVSKT
ncbi:hypothetical protein CYMTET_55457, partial [Cymbomonas tetramitiformis]